MTDEAVVQAEYRLALGYAPAAARPGVATLFALDARLRHIALVARDPTIGLMRLTWWADALTRLDAAPVPAEPLLRALARDVPESGVSGAALAGLVDGWFRILDGEADLAAYAAERGAGLFALAARLLGAQDARAAQVGEGWVLADLARGWPALADPARVMARRRLAGCYERRWPTALRPLGALGLLARSDLDPKNRPGSPRRIARLLAHRLTGR